MFYKSGPDLIVPFSHMMMHSPFSQPLHCISKSRRKPHNLRSDAFVIGLLMVNPLKTGNPKMSTFANSEDPYEMPQNVAFHQGLHCLLRQAFKQALLFLFFLLFPTFLICSYFSLLFHENARLSLLFHFKMSFTRKNPEIFPRSLRLFGFYKLASTFIQGGCCLTPQF